MDSDSYLSKIRCIKYLNLDVLCVAETHLKNDESFIVPGYSSICQNRTSGKRSNVGSGGVGVLVKEDILLDYNVSILDDSMEGILWLEFRPKYDACNINVCACYCPPEGSSRKIDVLDYFDTLLSQIYKYQNDGLFYVCGDFNSRIGNKMDFTEGVDNVSARKIIDWKVNSYGDIFIDFLNSASCGILNGRCGVKDDYTSVSVKGLAVVDYCFTSYENIPMFTDFEIKRAKVLFEDAGCVGE